ncbi:MAG: dihydroorotate dehydrogenase electron transfer subunit [Chlorobiales bacterium]|nr:dihydroorotate dehydrogenase electron transfer subunit [Chlorobiales bacterium]
MSHSATAPKPQIYDSIVTVVENLHLTSTVTVLVLESPEIAPLLKPGQFINLKVNDSLTPLLRRPISIHRVDGNRIEVMVKMIGTGTSLLYHASRGMKLQVLGPLGNTFGYERDDFDVAILVSGGIGIAPMALLEEALDQRGKEVHNFIGGRTKEDIVTRYLGNLYIATDDGSMGYKGTVVSLLANEMTQFEGKRIRVFSCGPNRMLEALSKFCIERNIPCEVSLESIMGCGIGICYGCPVRLKDEDGSVHNHLLCQCGSVIDASKLVFQEG